MVRWDGDEKEVGPTPNNLRILLSNPYRACSQENDKYDFDPQEDLIDQLHLDMGRIYATLRSSHTVWLPPGDGESFGALMAESFCAKQVVHRVTASVSTQRSTRWW